MKGPNDCCLWGECAGAGAVLEEEDDDEGAPALLTSALGPFGTWAGKSPAGRAIDGYEENWGVDGGG